ncbi:hypothetical protein FOL47_003220 [Perkinsus chesapeaki]|uniref:AP2/ERF domain-containing protein n=1 Tax=Perkinsus chesapeaki TaxID=330153 RepID=A0A7J6M8U0_PERCH|nr:hypothetical protein FOL47_003220 [Perkinsus chesapeaki]
MANIMPGAVDSTHIELARMMLSGTDIRSTVDEELSKGHKTASTGATLSPVETGTRTQKSPSRSGVVGVSWSSRHTVWRAQWRRKDGKKVTKSFYVSRYGYEEALQRAIKCRRDAEIRGEAVPSKHGTAVKQSGVVLRDESLNRMKDFEANHLFSLVLDKELYEACLDRVRQLGNKKDEAKGRGTGERPQPVNMDEMDTTVPAVLHETRHLSVIWKPAHWHVSVTSAIAGSAEEEVSDDTEGEEATRTEWVEEAYPGYPIARDRHHAYGILHRLDVGTSGPLLLAHSYKGFYMGRLVFCSHQIDKEYVTLVKGHMGTIGEKQIISDRIKAMVLFVNLFVNGITDPQVDA